ncbi:cupin domain-containing protein [Paenibacillus pinihumi]|uniref:cupin domain-containing protein n=1 Tax=Paenibacillus pinihumi TaxID=669462 RepID=UPI0004136EE8|nr:cupin domain-containing protein [Paenibacillus pinihumi]
MYIQSITPEAIKSEYGIQMRRVYQVNEAPFHPPFGSAWAFIAPGEQSAPHTHDEDETFYVVKGNGVMVIDDEEQDVQAGDTIYIPANHSHVLRNTGSEELVFITIWWDVTSKEDNNEKNGVGK